MRVDSITSRQAALTGSFTGSFAGNASGLTGIANATSASYALTASYAVTASYAISASHEITFELSSSHAEVADEVPFTGITGKPTLLSGSAQIASDISGSFTDLSSSIASDIEDIIDGTTTITSASYALTASYAENAGGGAGFPYTGSAEITGSLNVIGDLLQNGSAIETNPFPYSGTAQINGGLGVTGSVEFAYEVSQPAAWSAGGALITARDGLAGAGSQNAALAFGGYTPTEVSCTEEYNGSSWSAGGNLITARFTLGGAGTQNAGLAFGGYANAAMSCTEEYDGSSWAAGGNLITARLLSSGAGTQNAGLALSGLDSSFLVISCTEEYDGSSWSAGGALIVGAEGLGGAGTQNAGLAIGGSSAGTSLSCTEEYNGTSWSTGGALITARGYLAGAGEQNAGLAFGGNTPTEVSCTEEYNGSSWSAGGALSTARYNLGGAGTQNAGLAFGGASTSCTEEYSPGVIRTKTFDYSETTGETTVSCLIETSAMRYKQNIQPLGSQLNKIRQLRPVSFDWNTNKKHSVGFVADEVNNIYPELVSKNTSGQVEGMNYSKMVAVLVASVQEQQSQIEKLTQEIETLKNKTN
jgi:hypothetical protein